MQVEPIKYKLKAPRTKRLKLKHDVLLSSFAFNFNLRRYTTSNYVLSLDAFDLSRESANFYAKLRGYGPGINCPPRPPTRSETSFLERNIWRRIRLYKEALAPILWASNF